MQSFKAFARAFSEATDVRDSSVRDRAKKLWLEICDTVNNRNGRRMFDWIRTNYYGVNAPVPSLLSGDDAEAMKLEYADLALVILFEERSPYRAWFDNAGRTSKLGKQEIGLNLWHIMNTVSATQKDFENFFQHFFQSPNYGLSLFVHEFTHYYDNHRFRPTSVHQIDRGYSNDTLNRGNVGYYNNPLELNAYYQQAATVILDRLHVLDIKNPASYSTDDIQDISYFTKTPQSFVDWAYTYFRPEFLDNATAETERKMKSRLYQLYDGQARSYLQRLKQKLVVPAT